MGLFDVIKNALGLQTQLRMKDPETPLDLSDEALARLGELPEGHGIHIGTRSVEEGFVVHVEEGPLKGPPPEELQGLRATAADIDLQRLRGLTLHYGQGRWMVSLELEVRARETPNPDGRLYLVDRPLGTSQAAYFASTDAGAPPLAQRLLALEGVTSVLFRDNTVTISREKDSSWAAIDQAVDRVLRQYFLFGGRALTEDACRTLEGLAKEVHAVLQDRILPGVHQDGGDIELVSVKDGVVRVSMQGACAGCPSSTKTLKMGVERTLKQAFPGQIDRVEQV